MKQQEALDEARSRVRYVARPISWEGTAQGLTWDDEAQGWVHRHYSPNRGTHGFSLKRATFPQQGPGVLWQVVPLGTLAAEGELVVSSRITPYPELRISGEDHVPARPRLAQASPKKACLARRRRRP